MTATRQAWYALAIIGVLGVLLVAAFRQRSTPVRPLDLTGGQKNDRLELLVERFGRPDTDTSTADEIPRPPIVTRMLTYQDAGVRAIYMADIKFGAAVPRDVGWKLIGFTDPDENVALPPDVAIRRLDRRRNLGAH